MAARLVSQEEPLPGYRLLERLGRGGFGEVWKVEAPGGLLKAMKFVFGDLDSIDDDDNRPAEQELKALHRVKSIRHPYILSLERFDKVDGQLIIVMELADQNLWDRFRACRAEGHQGIPREELLRYMEESAEALDLMNDTYYIQHLDVKPQNIFLVHNHAKVADFGLAKDFGGDRGTITGGVTPVYAAPETFEGWVSRFTDQYSLGIVFQELLTGTRPFTGANTKQLLLQHLNGTPDLTPLPEADRPIIGRSLEKKPDDRWKSCTELVKALRQAGSSLGPTNSPSAYIRQRAETPRPPLSPQNFPPRSPVPMGASPPLVTPRPPGSGTHGSPPRLGLSTPGLLTPQLVTQQSGSAPIHTIQRPQVFQTGRMSSMGIAPPERESDGALFPTFVVAVGQTGLHVIKKLRQQIRDKFGSLEALTNIRYLFIDSDPDAAAQAGEGSDALSSREVLIARLNRPAHYLQTDRLPVDDWMPSGLLYKLPKNPGPAAGIRAFGRLALCDNYRLIAQRIRQEIETFLTDEPLEKAAAATKLGLRSNRPRIYLLSGTAGGTGSGMIVDLAYILKHELRSVGYRKPDVFGMLLVPPADKTAPKGTALVNTYAALMEIRHFSAGTSYQTRFDSSEAPISDAEPPFTRTCLVQLPKPTKDKEKARAIAIAASGIFTEILTPTGRVLDYVRTMMPKETSAPTVSLFGLYRFAWPRMELLSASTRRFGQRLLVRWASKDSAHLREPVSNWLDDQWSKQKLDQESVATRFSLAAKAAMNNEDPEAVFEAAIDTLRNRTRSGGMNDASVACSVLEQILVWVGKPVTENDVPGSLEAAILESRKKFSAELESNLASLSVSFIEQPQYRLAGAEEALNQITDRVKKITEEFESVRPEMQRIVAEAYGKALQVIGALGTVVGRRAISFADVQETLKDYARARLRMILKDAVLAVYRALLGHIPEYVRDVGFCRTRLGELGQTIGTTAATATDHTEDGTLILPAGCKSVDDAADQFLSDLTPEDILTFDQNIQREVARKFRGLANVCLKADRSKDFLKLLDTRSKEFLETRFETTDPATVFFRYQTDEAALQQTLAEGFDEAAPDMTAVSGIAPMETVVLAAPANEAGAKLREILTATCPNAEFIPAPLPDDILIYREYPRVEMTSIPQLAESVRESYEGHITTDTPPHTRKDIPWSSPGAYR